ncbi:MAG TPA: hypothetical protein VFK06_00925, partial [Candidatus Angelobacter sp.]|nr:hypothetical protein [Candidatus Angelobacter sp.]
SQTENAGTTERTNFRICRETRCHFRMGSSSETEASGAGRIMHTQMDRVGLVLRTVARCPGRYSKTAERNVSGSYCLHSSWR